MTMLCELDDEKGEVKWFKGDQEITADKRYDFSKFHGYKKQSHLQRVVTNLANFPAESKSRSKDGSEN